MKINQAGIDLIRHWEGCRLTAYKDIVGVLTIAYGHTGDDVVEGLEIDQETANKLLEADLLEFEEGLTRCLKQKVNDNQFSALVSFAYNLGLGALKSSTLLRLVNNGEFDKAANEFTKWCKAGGKVVNGLLKRREAERDLFLS